MTQDRTAASAIQLTVWGAAQQVTGSMHLLTLPDDFRILVDCGFDMEPLTEPSDSTFPFDPASIDVVLLTHAHMDHSGHIPNLIRQGFEGKVICTYATLELTRLLLFDSARLNEREQHRLKQKPTTRTRGPLGPEELFVATDVEDALNVFECHEPDTSFDLKPGVSVSLITAGHLLGAVHMVVSVETAAGLRKIAFSGDLGRKGYPLLRDPQPLPPVDYLVMETTYGNRAHQEKGQAMDVVAQAIQKACVDVPGRLIIPAFSVGRTQALLYTLNRLYQAKRLPPIRIFADSPLALQSTKVYAKYVDDMNAEARNFARDNGELFDFANLHYVKNMKQSREVNDYSEPSIIIASSGMVEGGRITHHIRTNLQNPFATIFFIGYSSPGTFGHQLQHGRDTMRVKGQKTRIMAEIAATDVFSGHGDVNDLVSLVENQEADRLRKIFLVHGDPSAMVDFKQTLGHIGYPQSEIAEKGKTYLLA